MSNLPEIMDHEVDSLLDAFSGNARTTIQALMHDLSIMVDQSNESGSRGFLRRDHHHSVPWARADKPGVEIA